MKTITVGHKKYDRIRIKDKRFGQTKTVNAVRIGQHLAVVDGYTILKLNTGTPLISSSFETLELAVEFAEWVREEFSEYFVLWYGYPEADIFALAKWSVEDGLKSYETIQALKDKDRINAEDITNAKVRANVASHYWTEQLRQNRRETREVQSL
jgi:hypothetical protein